MKVIWLENIGDKVCRQLIQLTDELAENKLNYETTHIVVKLWSNGLEVRTLFMSEQGSTWENEDEVFVPKRELPNFLARKFFVR
jgi:hypothetical protein